MQKAYFHQQKENKVWQELEGSQGMAPGPTKSTESWISG